MLIAWCQWVRNDVSQYSVLFNIFINDLENIGIMLTESRDSEKLERIANMFENKSDSKNDRIEY